MLSPGTVMSTQHQNNILEMLHFISALSGVVYVPLDDRIIICINQYYSYYSVCLTLMTRESVP